MHGITFNSSGNDWTMEIIIRRRNMSAIANNENNEQSHLQSNSCVFQILSDASDSGFCTGFCCQLYSVFEYLYLSFNLNKGETKL